MRRILFKLILVVAVIAAVGFYRGWFHVTSDGAIGTPNVTLTVDKDKIQDDKTAVREKAQDLGKRP